jgi:uncharacterized protein (TIGR00297 family)
VDLSELALSNVFIDSANPWLIAFGLNTVLIGIVAILPKKLLTRMGLLHAWALGVLIWGGLGWQGYVIVAVYFIVGSAVTRVGLAEKEAAGIAEKRSGARGPENVWGSAAIAALCTLAIVFLPQLNLAHSSQIRDLLVLGYATSFSTKLADTCASEIGKAYGKHTFLITTLKPVPRGTEGAVSLEGTLAGIGAAVTLAAIAWTVQLIHPWEIAIVTVAALIAINLESVIGATLQTKLSWLTNEFVNVLNTLIGAVVAIMAALALTAY